MADEQNSNRVPVLPEDEVPEVIEEPEGGNEVGQQRQAGQDLDVNRLKRQYENLKQVGPQRSTKPDADAKTPGQRPASSAKNMSDRGFQSRLGQGTQEGKAIRQAGAKTAGTLRGAGDSAARGLGKAASKVGSQAAKQALQFTARMAAQLARMAAQLAARAAAFLASNPVGWIILAVMVIVSLIIVAIIFFSIFTQGSHGEFGRSVGQAAAPVVDEHYIKDLKALAGDLKAREDQIIETAHKIIDALDAIEQKVGCEDPTKKSPKNKDEICNQVKKTQAAVVKLQVEVDNAPKVTGQTGGNKQLPKAVKLARDEALTEINKLVELLKSIEPLALQLYDQIIGSDSDQRFLQKGRANCYDFSNLLIAYLIAPDEAHRATILQYTNDTWNNFQASAMDSAMKAGGYYYINDGGWSGSVSDAARIARTRQILENDGFVQWHVQGGGVAGHWITILNVDDAGHVTDFDPADGKLHRNESITDRYLLVNSNDGYWGAGYTKDGKP